MNRRASARAWRSRGRKGQVAAIATLFGLMIVVTFVANYLTTTVPSEMAVNDLNHIVTVENQISRLAALMQAVGLRSAVGAQIVQPISLGSAGSPPFAPPDGASVGGPWPNSTISISYGLEGLFTYNPPLGYAAGGPGLPVGCTLVLNTLACVGFAGELQHNFNGNGQTFTVTTAGGANLLALNFSTNNSHINVETTGTQSLVATIFGSNDWVTFTDSGGSGSNVTVIGSSDSLNITQGGGSTLTVHVYGNHDTVNQGGTGNNPVLVTIVGEYDAFNANPTGGSNTYTAYVTGFNTANPSSSMCPYGNTSANDTLTGVGGNGNVYSAYYNNTIYSGTKTTSAWVYHFQIPTSSVCPFFSRATIPVYTPVLTGGGFVVKLFNTYIPNGEVAIDEGAVVYAQDAGNPVVINDPAIQLTGTAGHITAAAMWFPFFFTPVGSSRGIGTVVLSMKLLGSSIVRVNATSSYIALNQSVPVVISIRSVYAEAWNAYLSLYPIYSGLWTCAPAAVCQNTYEPGGTAAYVNLTIPATYLQTLTIATSSFAPSISA